MAPPLHRPTSWLGSSSRSLLGVTLVFAVLGSPGAVDRMWSTTFDLLAGLTLQGRLVLCDPLTWESRDLLNLE